MVSETPGQTKEVNGAFSRGMVVQFRLLELFLSYSWIQFCFKFCFGLNPISTHLAFVTLLLQGSVGILWGFLKGYNFVGQVQIQHNEKDTYPTFHMKSCI